MFSATFLTSNWITLSLNGTVLHKTYYKPYEDVDPEFYYTQLIDVERATLPYILKVSFIKLRKKHNPLYEAPEDVRAIIALQTL